MPALPVCEPWRSVGAFIIGYLILIFLGCWQVGLQNAVMGLLRREQGRGRIITADVLQPVVLAQTVSGEDLRRGKLEACRQPRPHR